MRLGYFGGSFDPPHRGHLAVAHAAREQFQLDLVLLAPTARQPLKPEGPSASWPDRLRMTELLCADQPGLAASAIDAPQPDGQPNYTVDTLRRLRAQFEPQLSDPQRQPQPQPQPKLFAILGADAFLQFPRWREPDELLRLAEWIIVSRPGFPLPEVVAGTFTPAQRAHLHTLSTLTHPLSATHLRTRLRAGEDCRGLLPELLLEFIRAHHLYGT